MDSLTTAEWTPNEKSAVSAQPMLQGFLQRVVSHSANAQQGLHSYTVQAHHLHL